MTRRHMSSGMNGEGSSTVLTRRRKRLFVVMATAAAVLVVLMGLTAVYLLVRHTEALKTWLVLLLEIGMAAFVVGVGVSLAAVIWFVLTDRSISPWMRRLIQTILLAVLPLATVAGRLLGRSRDEVQGSFIAVNNAVAERTVRQVDETEVLVLLPRCLQWADCVHKVTQDPEQCRGCGECALASILEVTGPLGVAVRVSTGGTQARRFVQQIRPRAIIAVACERELAEGIRDVARIPVIGVVNDRPEGPCYNTDVNVASLTMALQRILDEEDVDHVLVWPALSDSDHAGCHSGARRPVQGAWGV